MDRVYGTNTKHAALCTTKMEATLMRNSSFHENNNDKSMLTAREEDVSNSLDEDKAINLLENFNKKNEKE